MLFSSVSAFHSPSTLTRFHQPGRKQHLTPQPTSLKRSYPARSFEKASNAASQELGHHPTSTPPNTLFLTSLSLSLPSSTFLRTGQLPCLHCDGHIRLLFICCIRHSPALATCSVDFSTGTGTQAHQQTALPLLEATHHRLAYTPSSVNHHTQLNVYITSPSLRLFRLLFRHPILLSPSLPYTSFPHHSL